MKKIILTILTIVAFVPITALANTTDIYYTNHQGVDMKEEQYNLLSTKLSKEIIANLPQDKFDIVINDLDKIEEEQSVVYVQSIYYKDRFGEITYEEEEITEEEYNNFVTTKSYTDCATGAACWETNAKKLYLAIGTFTDDKSYMYILTNEWKSIPTVKSFDVIALRWDLDMQSSFTVTNYYGFQTHDGVDIKYAKGGDNSKLLSNGVGISMNIVDSVNSSLMNQLMVFGYYGTTGSRVIASLHGTYQHAVRGVTLDKSKSYTFGSNGLGGVLKYNNTIASYYDGMQGISYYSNPLFHEVVYA